MALASGFSSVRRFNDTFRNLFRRPPSALRRKGVDTSARDGVTLRLAYRPPYDWSGTLSALSLCVTPGTEWIDKDVWHRSIDLDGKRSSVAVAHSPERNSVLVTICFPSVKALPAIVARVRRVFDLGAEHLTIDRHLARDPRSAVDQETARPARARRLGEGDGARRAGRCPGRHGGHGMPMPRNISEDGQSWLVPLALLARRSC